MLKYIVMTICLAIGVANIAKANTIDNGTYIGSRYKRVNIYSYDDQGTHQYQMLLGGLYEDNALIFKSASSQPISPDREYSFIMEPDPYGDEEPSSCIIKAKWDNNGSLILNGGNGCESERKFFGMFSFAKEVTNIPSEYHGLWDETNKCSGSHLVVMKDVFNPDYDYGAVYPIHLENIDGGWLKISGYELYENFASSSYVQLKKQGSKLLAKGHHHGMDFNRTLVPCTD